LVLLLAADFDSLFEQVSPADGKKAADRAIILINGLKPHPFDKDAANRPLKSSWQSADSTLGKALTPHGDLFIFCYSQNRAVDQIPDAQNKAGKALGDYIAELKAKGYGQIVIVGHSAGGLIARQFVEDHPDAGVTRVVQAASPNTGAALGEMDDSVRDAQEPFVQSLSKASRKAFLEGRKDKKIPASVEFAVVVANGTGSGDTVVDVTSQWPEDLQAQGIPMVETGSIHFTVPRSRSTAKTIAGLVSTAQPRWTDEKVEKALKGLKDTWY
jgi:pimeloyl-ACP methyl ester carboxylesterase